MAPYGRRRTSRGRTRSPRTGTNSRRSRSRSQLVRAIQDYVIQPAIAAAIGPAGGVGLGLGTAASRYADQGVGTSPTRLRSVSSTRSRSMSRSTSRKRSVGPMKGRKYMKKSKKSYKSDKNFEQISRCGIVSTEEIHGTANDPDCVYIIAQSLDAFRAVSYMTQALVRKLFWKAGVTITNMNSEIPSRSYDNSTGWRVVLYGDQLETGVESVIDSMNTADNQTFVDVADRFTDNFLQYSSGYTTVPGAGNTSNLLAPKRLALFNADNTQIVFVCDLNLDEEICHYKSYMTLKIQNRSVSNLGLSEADEVGNNPIQGYVYNFQKQPVFKVRGNAVGTSIDNNMEFNQIPVNYGVKLIQANVNQISPALREPPYSSVFANCKSRSPVYIHPGEIKTYSSFHKGKMSFLKLLQLMKVQYGVGAAFSSQNNPFPHIMVALEDVINQNVNRLTIAYECERKSGYYFTTSKKTGALGNLLVTEYDAEAA